jgi:RHS repeat-associated protein
VIGRIGAMLLCGVLLCPNLGNASEAPVVGLAQAPPKRPPSENLVTAAMERAAVKTIGEDVFGESLSLATGALGFEVTDIDLAGSGPPVRLVRHRDTARDFHSQLNRLGDWDLQVPRITTTGGRPGAQWSVGELPHLWSVRGPSPMSRCSSFGAPPDFHDQQNNTVRPESWWQGAELRVPGRGAQALLKRSPTWTLAPDENVAAHPIVTVDGWAISCLPSTKNGVAGEAFLARSPDGMTWRFDWFVATRSPIAKGTLMTSFDSETAPGESVHVFEVNLYATRVTDRFGNTVDYTYEDDKLVRIVASDGREIQLSYADDADGYPKLTKAVVPGTPSRTWTYQRRHFEMLDAVVLPDGNAWRFPEGKQRTAANWHSWSLKMRAPSGVEAEFEMVGRERSRATSACPNGVSSGMIKPMDPWTVVIDTLVVKRYAGPGVDATWRYYYLDEGTNPAKTVVVHPDGSRTHYAVVSSSLSALDGLVLRKEEGAQVFPEHRDWTVRGTARTTLFDYHTLSTQNGVAPQAVANRARLEYRTVEKRRVITQDGVEFTRRVDAFDALGRPTRVVMFANGPTRTTSIAYHDHIGAWVLGQVASSTNVESGLVESRTEYDATTAMPLRTHAFERLQQRLTWYGNGNLSSASDGRDGGTVNTTVGYASYKRGIPQLISHPDATSLKLAVDDFGQILSATDETGAKTCHAYDVMGRVSKTTFPSETQSGACDETAWNPVDSVFEPVETPEYGLAAGHWRKRVTNGNAQTLTYYDALWRPVLSRVFDAADITNTLSQVVTRYDGLGRIVFQSYPTRSTITNFNQSLPGVRTTYDHLGRPVRVEQDAEAPWTTLVTTLQYETNFITRLTNPRGKQTTFAYQVFDEPMTDKPVAIAQLGGAFTGITRDVFGKPTKLTRRNADHSVSVSRSYTYDSAQALCRIVEPESGATLFGYDAAGNLKWSAAGLPGSTPCDAEGDTTAILARKATRHHDARNRVTQLVHQDGRGDSTFAYTPDGLPATQVVDNGDGNVVETRYQYNARRLPTHDTMAWGAVSVQWSVLDSYSRNGHLSHREYPRNLSLYFAPNALGQPTKAGEFATGVTYHPNGALKGFTYGNGVVHTATQNARQLPLRSRDAHGTTAIFDDNYDYDPNANVAAISDGLPGHRGDRTMVYDTLDRLVSAASPMFGGTVEYAYDVLDNITSLTATNRSHRYCYDDGTNRLTFIRSGSTGCTNGAATTSFAYDLQGNITGKNNVAYQFDLANRLRSTTGGVNSSYVYDASGRRVRDTTTGTRYSFYTRDGKLALTSNNRIKESSNYIYLGDRLVATRTWQNGVSDVQFTTRYHHTDALGSPVAVTDANRNVVERTEYEPYGKVINRAMKDGIGFTGHVEDAATGMTYMQQRLFDRDAMRFPSVDPVRPDLEDGSNFNRYWYASNNPYRYIDPDGREIRYAADASPDFLRNVAKAIRYLNSAGAANGIGTIFADPNVVVTVRPTADRADIEKTRYHPATNEIFWADYGGAEAVDSVTGKRGILTPALALGHEFEHAMNDLYGGISKDSRSFDAQFDTQEEKNVIEEYEIPAAGMLGEPRRADHRGIPIKVNCPIQECE